MEEKDSPKCTRCKGTGYDPEHFEPCLVDGIQPTACIDCNATGRADYVEDFRD